MSAWASLSDTEVLKLAPMEGNFSQDEAEAFCAGFRRCAKVVAALSHPAVPPNPFHRSALPVRDDGAVALVLLDEAKMRERGIEYHGQPVVVSRWIGKLKTTLAPMRLAYEDVVAWSEVLAQPAIPLRLEACDAAASEPEVCEDDVGALAYRGNTVSYMYDRAKAYGDEIMRTWFAIKDAGLHPGRTDERLSDCVKRLLAAPSPAPAAAASGWVEAAHSMPAELTEVLCHGFDGRRLVAWWNGVAWFCAAGIVPEGAIRCWRHLPGVPDAALSPAPAPHATQEATMQDDRDKLAEALSDLYHALPDVMPASAVERFQKVGKWSGPSPWALRGHTGTVTFRADDMASLFAAMDRASQTLAGLTPGAKP